MANLTAKFSLVDQISDKLDSISRRGHDILSTWDEMREEAKSSFGEATSAAEQASASMSGVGRAAEEAAQSTDHWTDAVGNYDKSALEAIYSTEELVEMGFKSADALEEQGDKAEQAGHAAENLADANEKAKEATEHLSDAAEKAGEELEKNGEKGKDSMETLEQTIAAAGITVMLKEMAEGAYELADAFSEAEKTVVLATGATGEALEELEKSMMRVYSQAKSADLSSTAGAIGEINTRLGLTGEKLENTTELFLDYANVTGQNVVPAVQNVTKIMNQWDVELNKLPGLLDDLTYAGQISGINVASLSDALVTNKGVLQSLGFTLEESIGLFAKLELQGVSTQTAMTGFRTALNKFSKDGEEAETALQGLIDKIINAKSETEATSIAVDYFGSSAGAALASSIRSGQLSIDNLSASLEKADGALDKTAITSQTMSEKWQKSTNNMDAAITNALQPTIDKLTSWSSGVMDKVADFLNAHPKIVKALAAITVGLGVFVAGIAAYTIATKAATIATTALTAVMDANPIFLAITAVTALTIACVGLVSAMSEEEKATERLSPLTQKHTQELEQLNAEYKEACDKFGEASAEAQELQWEIDELSSTLESNRQTYYEWREEMDKAIADYEEFSANRQQSIEAADLEHDKLIALANRLDELANKSDRSATEQNEMLVIMERLNKEVPNLSLNFDDLSNSLDGVPKYVMALVEAEAKIRKIARYQDELDKSFDTRYDLEPEIKKAQAEYDAALANKEAKLKAYNDAVAAAKKKGEEESKKRGHNVTYTVDISYYKEAQDALGEFSNASQYLHTLQKEYDNNEEHIRAITDDIIGLGEEATQANENYANSIEGTSDTITQSLTDLADAYDEAYQSAKASFDGQFRLFDTATAKVETTVASTIDALDSQLEYWTDYADTIGYLTEYEKSLTGEAKEDFHKLLKYISDGSPEAAGLAQSMVNSIKNGDTMAVTELAATVGKVEEKRDEAAGIVAEWQVDFSNKMDSIIDKINDTIIQFDVSEDAESAAWSTIHAYAEALLSGGEKAVENAKSIASQVKAALSGGEITLPDGYAEGTDYATPGVKLVGENGPELLEFKGGERVYNTEETKRILARSEAEKYISPPSANETNSGSSDDNSTDNIRIIRLELNGSGSIELNGSMDEDEVVEIIQDHLKPVLVGIVKQEIYEEGEESYDF